ncbi:MauE/DoxX family redox-associated membrane protein [Niastella populi]|uniref:Methylamine utilisation protein MauE domain-containing protein n=1 Tax=Niastella populi TaxID=550983 RepID=A0A1V9GB64_9BACT|nr:MauE/DoxX family redox-associated membrane protein [Niastella populi]OQP67794.1 hypothetical protein A4R26_32855 [Niastella populi]
MKRNNIIETVTILYIILFLYTGISKMMEYSVFKEQLASSPVLSPFANIIAILLPLTEILLVLLLIVPRWRLKGLYSSVLLMLSFTIYIIIILSFSDKLPCSCGGAISLLSWQQHLVFNGAFLTLGVWAITLEKQLKNQNRIEWETPTKNEIGTIA